MPINAQKLKYLVDINSTIEEAWSQIEINQHRSIIIVDKGKVVGTLSDGDLRKAMLAHRLLSAPVKEAMNTNFIVITEKDRDKTQSIFQEKDIFLLPVVDKQMNLLDIVIR